MSGSEESSDKSFEATQQKLLDARKKGEFARSTEILTAAGYSGFLIAILATGLSIVSNVGHNLMIVIDQAGELAPLFFSGSAGPVAGGLMSAVALSILPVFVTPAFAVVITLFAMRGIVFAPEKIKPKLSKISPIANAKNKYGRTGLFQFAVSAGKLAIYSVCLGFFLRWRLDEMVQAIRSDPFTIVALLADVCVAFLIIMVIVSAVIGVIDAVWQHFEHLRKNRMSRKEVMDETKNSEGDPHLKQERRRRAHAIAETQMMSDVPGADVIIVNPTHYAVALKWDRKPGRAPVCVAKGVDEIALKIREIAEENAVPIHSDPPAARALHATTQVNDEISQEHYRAVAAAIRFADAIRKKSNGRHS